MKKETIENWVRLQISLLWVSTVAGLLMPVLYGWWGLLLIPAPWVALQGVLLFINVVLTDTVEGYSEVFEEARERI
jgi:hypothetical protein